MLSASEKGIRELNSNHSCEQKVNADAENQSTVYIVTNVTFKPDKHFGKTFGRFWVTSTERARITMLDVLFVAYYVLLMFVLLRHICSI